jgi:hypothetical protein
MTLQIQQFRCACALPTETNRPKCKWGNDGSNNLSPVKHRFHGNIRILFDMLSDLRDKLASQESIGNKPVGGPTTEPCRISVDGEPFQPGVQVD